MQATDLGMSLNCEYNNTYKRQVKISFQFTFKLYIKNVLVFLNLPSFIFFNVVIYHVFSWFILASSSCVTVYVLLSEESVEMRAVNVH